uniref:acyl-CoA (8-3)-desaturase n=1 Tax=Sphaeramia orbicularis TaxID=375764 RepID=A0A673A5K5_9TELE
MGGGGQLTEPGEPGTGGSGRVFTWEEVQRHSHRNDQWLVIDRKVYNVTQWAKRHPGGFRVISHYAGEDATEAFKAFHHDGKFAQKFLRPLQIGELAATEPSQDHNKNAAIVQDFHTLRAQAEDDGLFRVRPMFFCFYLGHILLLEALGWLTVWVWGTSWMLTLLCSIILATAQIQSSWLQHDFGHKSVFKTTHGNHIMQMFIMGHLKGASTNWWNHRHFQHHAKPNVFSKDPDVNMLHVFVVGAIQPVEYGIKKIKYMPYHRQHQYFFFVGAPLVLPVYFQLQMMHSMIYRHHWVVRLSYLILSYLILSYLILSYLILSYLILSLISQFLESHWFVWVTQMNHLPMDIDHEAHQDWLTMQLHATCNIEQSSFNDWFSGHLNFQIEHHLFPTMPRHNYYLVAPLVQALCEKHGIPYQVKTMRQGLADVLRSLKNSGELWLDAYLHK